MALKLGKKDFVEDKRDIKLGDVMPKGISLPTIPKPHGGYGTDFSNWGMLGNGPEDDGSIPQSWAAAQGAGDCVFAGAGHEIMESSLNSGKSVPKISCMTALEHYSSVTGYDLQTGANDNGTEVRQALLWRQQTGYADDAGDVHKIGTFVSLTPGNWQQLWDALWLFEAVGIGIQFPGSAMNQFNNGQMWEVVSGAQIEGGHYIPIVGHPRGGLWTVVTWGKRQLATWNFINTYCDEAWAWIDPERYNQVTGKTLEGYTDADLEQYITLLSQQINKA